jgi:hypothetical protein
MAITKWEYSGLGAWVGTIDEVMTTMSSSGPSLLTRPGTQTGFPVAGSLGILFIGTTI